MKKLLYGSTALVAAGLLSGTAAAEEGIDADISGGWLAQFASVSQDDGVGESAANRRDHGFTRFGTISIAGDTTLDNGLQVGVAFDWNTENGGTGEVSRDGYGWMEFGGFRVEFGARNSAAYQMAYSAPGGGGGHGFNSPVFQNATTPGTNDAGASFGQVNISGGSEKVTIFTPRFGGFQLGASYTPEQGKAPSSVSIFSGPDLDNDAGEQSEIVAVGANFVESFDELDVNVGVGWEEGDRELSSATAGDQEQWHVGASLSWMGWTFGGSYVGDDQGLRASSSDRTLWNAGISYVTGPWTIGAMYLNTEVELGGSSQPGAVATGVDEADRYELSGSYEVGPGISFHAGIQIYEWEADRTNAADRRAAENDSTGVYFGTSIDF